MKRSWYYTYLDQEYPQVTAASRDKINTLLEDLAAFDKDPRSFDASPTLNQRINRHFYDVLIALISTQIPAAPVSVTFDLADPKGEMDFKSMMKYVNEKYEF